MKCLFREEEREGGKANRRRIPREGEETQERGESSRWIEKRRKMRENGEEEKRILYLPPSFLVALQKHRSGLIRLL